MKVVNQAILVLFVAAASFAQGQTVAQPIPVSVDCGSGQSLNWMLSRLDPKAPYTVSVKGTCAEYVHSTFCISTPTTRDCSVALMCLRASPHSEREF